MTSQNNLNAPTPFSVSVGGTGFGSAVNPYGVVCAGTYSTGPFQTIQYGSAGQVFTANGPAALPSWQTWSPSSVPVGGLSFFCNDNGDGYLAPSWLKCDGSLYDQSAYPTLFSRIGYLNPLYFNQYTLPVNGTPMFITYGNGIFVVVTSGPDLATSIDGMTWTERGTPSNVIVNGLGFDNQNNVFMLVDNSGNFYTSSDAITWSSPVTVGSATGSSIPLLYAQPNSGGPKYYVYEDQLYTSPDGVTWTVIYRATNSQLTGFARGIINGTAAIVAVGTTGSTYTIPGILEYSPDSETWYSISPVVGGYSQPSIAYDGTNLITVGSGGQLAVSTDGVWWSCPSQSFEALYHGVPLYTVAYGTSGGNHYYVIAGNGNTTVHSTDLATWTTVTAPTTNTIYSVCYGSHGFLYGAGGGDIALSTDGSSWTTHTSGTSEDIGIVAYLNGHYMYGGTNGAFGYSTDGVSWTTPSFTVNPIGTICYGGGIYVVTGGYNGGGGTYYSTDLTTWNTAVSNPVNNPRGMAYGAGVFVAACGAGQVSTSPDGNNWTFQVLASGNMDWFNGVVWTGTKFIMGGVGVIWTSLDGYNWTMSNPSSVLEGITSISESDFGDHSTFVITATDGSMAQMQSGVLPFNVIVKGNGTQNYQYLTYGLGNFIASGSGGIATSSNFGLNFAPAPPTTYVAGPAAAGSTAVVAVNVNSAVCYTTPDGGANYDMNTKFQVPTDAYAGITVEAPGNFERGLYIKAQ